MEPNARQTSLNLTVDDLEKITRLNERTGSKNSFIGIFRAGLDYLLTLGEDKENG